MCVRFVWMSYYELRVMSCYLRPKGIDAPVPGGPCRAAVGRRGGGGLQSWGGAWVSVLNSKIVCVGKMRLCVLMLHLQRHDGARGVSFEKEEFPVCSGGVGGLAVGGVGLIVEGGEVVDRAGDGRGGKRGEPGG